MTTLFTHTMLILFSVRYRTYTGVSDDLHFTCGLKLCHMSVIIPNAPLFRPFLLRFLYETFIHFVTLVTLCQILSPRWSVT